MEIANLNALHHGGIWFLDKLTLAVYILLAGAPRPDRHPPSRIKASIFNPFGVRIHASLWKALRAYARFIINILVRRPTPSFRRQTLDSLFTFIRELNAMSSISQMQSLLPSTPEVYTRWARKNGIPIQIDSVPSTQRNDNHEGREQDERWANTDETLTPSLLWLGERNATKIILYIHGGGFWAPALEHNFIYLHALQASLRRQGMDVTFVALSYSLLPDTSLKSQIHQARNALEYLLSTNPLNDPSNVYISGDSAGGALCLSLASHILHPIPGIPPLHLSAPLGGIILISPWVRIYRPQRERKEVAKHGAASRVDLPSDVCTPETFAAWGQIVKTHSNLLPPPTANNDNNVPASPAMNYINPLDAPPIWFEHFAETVTTRVFITSGGKEVFHPDIVNLTQVLKRSNTHTHTDASAQAVAGRAFECVHVVDEDAVHDQFLMSPALGWFVGWGWDEQGKRDNGEAFLKKDKISRALVDWLLQGR